MRRGAGSARAPARPSHRPERALGDRLGTAVLRVDEQRRTRVAQVNADLVGAPGERRGPPPAPRPPKISTGTSSVTRRLARLAGPGHPHPGATGGHQRRVDPDRAPGAAGRRAPGSACRACPCSKARLAARCEAASSAKSRTPEVSRSSRWTTHTGRPELGLELRSRSGGPPSSLRPGTTGTPAGLSTATSPAPGPEDGDHSTSSAGEDLHRAEPLELRPEPLRRPDHAPSAAGRGSSSGRRPRGPRRGSRRAPGPGSGPASRPRAP